MHMSVELTWTVAQPAVLESGAIAFPTLPAAAGIYRFRVTHAKGVTHAYVGETDNLRRRMAGYRNPGPSQLTNQRVNALLRTALKAAAGTVEVATATDARITVNGADVHVDLSSKSQRLLLESAALVEAEHQGVDRSLNL